jgi:hypothetical protein
VERSGTYRGGGGRGGGDGGGARGQHGGVEFPRREGRRERQWQWQPASSSSLFGASWQCGEGGWSRGMRVARGIKRESQGPRRLRLRLRLGAVRFCAVALARVRRTRTSGRTGSGGLAGGTAARSAVCGGCWLRAAECRPRVLTACFPRCSRRDDRSFVGRDDHILSQWGALLRY